MRHDVARVVFAVVVALEVALAAAGVTLVVVAKSRAPMTWEARVSDLRAREGAARERLDEIRHQLGPDSLVLPPMTAAVRAATLTEGGER